jgi:hypothetical protein
MSSLAKYVTDGVIAYLQDADATITLAPWDSSEECPDHPAGYVKCEIQEDLAFPAGLFSMAVEIGVFFDVEQAETVDATLSTWEVFLFGNNQSEFVESDLMNTDDFGIKGMYDLSESTSDVQDARKRTISFKLVTYQKQV